MDSFEKQAKIQRIAQDDFPYTFWIRIFEKSEKAFRAFADSQPEAIRTILWSYAQSGRMMNQRLLNLACEHMDFPASDNEV